MNFSRGVRTATGVVVGRTTVTEMVRRYRGAGFNASSDFIPAFQARFVTVKRKGTRIPVIGAFATKKFIELLSIPSVQGCD